MPENHHSGDLHLLKRGAWSPSAMPVRVYKNPSVMARFSQVVSSVFMCETCDSVSARTLPPCPSFTNMNASNVLCAFRYETVSAWRDGPGASAEQSGDCLPSPGYWGSHHGECEGVYSCVTLLRSTAAPYMHHAMGDLGSMSLLGVATVTLVLKTTVPLFLCHDLRVLARWIRRQEQEPHKLCITFYWSVPLPLCPGL